MLYLRFVSCHEVPQHHLYLICVTYSGVVSFCRSASITCALFYSYLAAQVDSMSGSNLNRASATRTNK